MFRIGDTVRHKTTGKIGKIVGYGSRLRNNTYFMTLIVKPLKRNYFKPLIEDRISQWCCVRLNYPQLLDSDSRRRKLTV